MLTPTKYVIYLKSWSKKIKRCEQEEQDTIYMLKNLELTNTYSLTKISLNKILNEKFWSKGRFN